MQPFKPGDRLIDHAAPIGEVMQQLQTQLAEYKALKEHLAGGATGTPTATVSFEEAVQVADDGAISASSSSSSLPHLQVRSDSSRSSDGKPRDTGP